MHVDQVLAGVPKADRCEGHTAEQRQGGFVQKLLGRS
jgi:hypothetical protein